jgi:hypothetical protein
MAEILLSPESMLIFDIEAMTDVIQSSTSLLYNCDSTNSVIIYEAPSNCPSRYSISSSVGVLNNNQTCLIAVLLISYEMGLVQFLSTVPGDYFLLDQIVVLIAEIQGSAAATFCELRGAEKQESILENFLINSGYIRKELWCMLSSVFFPESKNIASSLADNDDLAFSTVDTECPFAMETETVP